MIQQVIVMINEQLEVRISGRDFGISLKGYNPEANREIRAQLAGETDLLVLLRAYLDVVHQKCELESRIAQLHEKLESIHAAKVVDSVKPPQDSTEASESQRFITNPADSVLDSRESSTLDSAATNPASLELAIPESTAPISAPDDLFSVFDTGQESPKQESPAL